MKEIRKILSLYDSRKGESKKAALATVIRIEGSSFRRIGARMLVYEDGVWTGGISGGCLEGDILKKAKKAILGMGSGIISYDTRDGDPYQIGIGLGCRGKIDIFLDAIHQDEASNQIELLRKLYDSPNRECIAHVLSIGFEHPDLQIGKTISQFNPFPDGLPSEFREDFQESLHSGTTKLKDYDTVLGPIQLLFEVISERINLIIVGSNYDIPSVVSISNLLEWDIHLIGDISKLGKETIGRCSQVLPVGMTREIPSKLLNRRTALLLMSHDYKTDLEFLKNNLNRAIPYIGILGPKSRFDELLVDLRKEGITLNEEELAKIHAPIGLDIGADNPDAIALSICSEILAYFNNRSGGSLKYRGKKIYDEYQITKSSKI